MSCCCSSEKRIIIVWGDDTDFEGQTFVTINLTSNVWDLSKMKATFELGGVLKTFNDISTGVIGLSYIAEETKQMPFGNIYGTLRVFNEQDQSQTIESLIPFKVITLVSGQTIEKQPYEYSINVEKGGTTVMNIEVTTRPAFSLFVGNVETLPSGEDAYVNVTSSGTVYTINFGIPRGEQGIDGKDGVDGKDATINGVNTLNVSATNGIQFIQSGDNATIDGSLLQTKANLVTSVSSSSTDSQYPSAKLFYDTCGDIESLINNL